MRAIQRLAFGDLSRYGYPRSDLGAFTRITADGVTVADLVTGACAVLLVFAANTGAARTETASSAAETVFNMDNSS